MRQTKSLSAQLAIFLSSIAVGLSALLLISLLNTESAHAYGACGGNDGPEGFGAVYTTTRYRNSVTGATGSARYATVTLSTTLGEGGTRSSGSSGSTCWGGLRCGYVDTGGFFQSYYLSASGRPSGLPSGGSWSSGGGILRNGAYNHRTLTYTFTPRINVSGSRSAGTINGHTVPLSQYSGQTVRVRNTAQGYNQTDNSGTSYYFSNVPAGSIWVAGSNSNSLRMRHRVNGGSWSAWRDDAYTTTTQSVLTHGSTLNVDIQYGPPPLPEHTTTDSETCQSTTGQINLDYIGSASVRFKSWLEGDPEPSAWQQEQWYGSGYGTQGSYSFTLPDVDKDAYRDTFIRVRHMYSPRNENNHDAFRGSIGLCGDYFLYEPSVDSITNEDDRGNRKPGQNFTVRSSVYNNGLDRSGVRRTGFNYDYNLEITQGAAYVDSLNSLNLARPGIQTGATDTIPGRNFRIVDDAPHGAAVCFRAEIDPTEGQAWPASGARVVQNSSQSNIECFNVYNEQFELSDISLSGDVDYVTPSPGGSSLNIEVLVENNGNINNPPAPINNTGAVGGTSNGVVTRLDVYSRSTSESTWGAPIIPTRTSSTQVGRGAGGVTTLTYSHPIPQSTSEDTVYCFVASANPVSGWSDGSNWGGAPFNDNPVPVNTGNLSNCQNETRVTTQPYFQTHRNDIHSGVSFARPDSPLSGCEPIDTSRGFIDAARTDSYGSLGEYAVYGTGPIEAGVRTGFGSSATSTSSPSLAAGAFFTSSAMSNRLTFANQGTLGNLGSSATRCMSNLYEMLEKTDGVVNIGSDTLGNFGGQLGTPATEDVQAYRNGDLTVDTGTGFGTFNRRATIVVNGDLYIDRDLTAYNPGGQHLGGNLAFIVRGDINIHERVEQVDALLYAIPDENTGDGGVLDTCYNQGALGTDVCGEQLIINGAVVADRLDLKRTHGGLSADRDQEPAEVFRFSPLHYLTPPYFIFSEDAPRPDLEVQQMIDLPPRF